MSNQTVILNSENDTQKFAQELSKELKRGDVLALYGELGMGKTFFTRELCHFLGVTEPVNSPSYMILQEYTGKMSIFHLDLYRLESEEELLEIGLYDILDEGITIIEWPEIAENYLPKNTIRIKFMKGKDISVRKLIVTR